MMLGPSTAVLSALGQAFAADGRQAWGLTVMALAGLLAGLGLRWLVWRLRPKRRRSTHGQTQPRLVLDHSLWGRRVSWIAPPLPPRWLAVRVDRPELVCQALRLDRLMPCSWQDGFSLAHEDRLFVSAPVQGWVLVMGTLLPDPAQDVDRCFVFVQQLSRWLGVVQFFSRNRLLNHHAWVWAEQGRIVRAYAWAGQTLWNQGALTPAERDLGLTCLDYATAPPPRRPGEPDPLQINTERVSRLAARWGVDPQLLERSRLANGWGVVGQLSRWQFR